MTELFSSRIAAEIDLSEDAYIIEFQSTHGVIFHLAPLGLMHSISFTEGERSVTPSRDFSHVLYNYLRSQIISTLNHTNTCAAGSTNDEMVRNRQVEVFISLVLDVKQSGASSLQLATPALHALQMSLQSQLQPTNVFTSEFLSVLVSLLNPRESNEHEFHSNGNCRSNSRSSSSSRSTIAEDLISMILHKLPWNSDLLLDVLFSSLKYDSLQVYSTAQISILSQALGTYFKTSLPYIITKHVKESKLSSKHEVVGINREKADNLWRNSLTLGDTLEATAYTGNQSITSSRLFSSQWVTATIVNIDYRSNTLTLEYHSTSPSSVSTVNDEQPHGTEIGNLTGKSSKLLQVSRINSSIRPIGLNNSSSDTAYVREFPEVNRYSGVRTSLSTPPPFYPASASASTSILDVEVESEDDIQYLVENNHKLRVDLIFKSMNNQKWTGLDGLKTGSISNDENNQLNTTPKCLHNHDMIVTLLSDKSQHLYDKKCNKSHLKCNQCTQISQINKFNDTKGWYCKSCNYLLCFSCLPCLPLERDVAHYLNGPKGEIQDINSVGFQQHQNTLNISNLNIRSFLESDIGDIKSIVDSTLFVDYGDINNDIDNVINYGNNDKDSNDNKNDDNNNNSSSNDNNHNDDNIDTINNNKHVLQYPLSSCTSPEARTPTTPPPPKEILKKPKASEASNCNINSTSFRVETPTSIRNEKVQDPCNVLKDNCSIAHLVELSIILDKARKDQILNTSKNILSNEKQAGIPDVSSILNDLLSCALIVFEKVAITLHVLCHFFYHYFHYLNSFQY